MRIGFAQYRLLRFFRLFKIRIEGDIFGKSLQPSFAKSGTNTESLKNKLATRVSIRIWESFLINGFVLVPANPLQLRVAAKLSDFR